LNGDARWEPGWGGGYIAASRIGSTSAFTTASNFVRLAHLRPGSRILDLGCGHGRITQLVAKLVADLDIVAVDLTRDLLDSFVLQPGDNGCRLQLLQVNLEGGLPFGDGRFDAAVSARVFHYLSDPIACVRDAGRVVRPGGRVVISVPNRMNPIKYATYHRARLYSPAQVAGWFNAAGFRNVTKESMCFFPSTRGWRNLASMAEVLRYVPLVKLMGGNALVWGEKP
jgi:ubiquinone/menaquinone biosynthesis C-methylase UbiE